MKRGDLIDLDITAFADRGKSLGRADDGRVVFVAGAVPGDRVKARVFQTKRRHAEARLETLVEASALRVAPRCHYFGTCGGCKWQHVNYAAQLQMKRQSVVDALVRTGGLEGVPEVRPTLGSARVYFYRNKMEFSFADERWMTWEEMDEHRQLREQPHGTAPAADSMGSDTDASDAANSMDVTPGASSERLPRQKEFALGLHAPGSFAKVLDLHECHLESALSVALVNRVRDLALEHGWTAYGQRSHEGWMRHLLVRHGHPDGGWNDVLPGDVPVVSDPNVSGLHGGSAAPPDGFAPFAAVRSLHGSAAHGLGMASGETLVNLVTNGLDDVAIATLARVLQDEFPAVTTFVHTVHTGLGPTALDAPTHVVFGPGVLHDRIGELTFEIAPHAFFQTNTHGAETLYAVARAFAELGPDDLVYDLYCGAGTISLTCAPHVRHVVGVELVPEAIENAWANAARNGIGNATFFAGDLLALFTPAFIEENGPPDVLILDPPRAGVHPRVMAEIARLAPPRIVYVSCNPQTQARDLAVLMEASGGGYRLDAVQPVDMFPHTSHVETVVRLTRTDVR